ncbi:hypothetical protein D3C81_1854110 [compost metagenome]
MIDEADCSRHDDHHSGYFKEIQPRNMILEGNSYSYRMQERYDNNVDNNSYDGSINAQRRV